MGTVYAIANQKGGVGKTTTAVNVGACIAEAGYATLLVDVDPQANATVGLGIPRAHRPGLYDVLAGEATAAEAIRHGSVPALAVLPAGEGLAGANIELPRIDGFERLLNDRLEPVRDRFQYVLLDCPPSLGPLTLSALVAADRVIVPVQTEYFALEGLAGLLDTLAMAYAETGQFERAAETLKQALDRLSTGGEQAAVESLRARLLLFESRQPYREDFSKQP